MNGESTGSVDTEWFTDAVALVGEVIGFWGFKENHGRIWALLYLSPEPVCTSTIRNSLDLSKGATSMLLNELEDWKVILQSVESSGRERKYRANPNFIEMIVRVMERRESDMLSQMVSRLEAVQQEAGNADATPSQIKALQEMVDLATMVKQLVSIGQKMQQRNIKDLSSLLSALDTML